ncbi:MAG TPA: Gfo/Idh/MocA family oxidoreductase [Leptolyngbyaceae cyanobacterium M65_K2018_010]|nr:Gfo/Idh/MocA family oxidoreductase [Leptolyngbyaceae cyanobacterium M65_K2018_010]
MVNVGLIGTGFVARLRADALVADGRGHLVAVAGHHSAQTQAFVAAYGARALGSWTEVVADPAVDLVMVCHINSGHSQVAAAALAAQKHVVVEYPLALSVAEAEALVIQAETNQRLLHVEHIELLGGTHQALKAHLPLVGPPFYARYATLSPKRPAPDSWTYYADRFGFPLVGALSRIHRLVDCFGAVEQVYCHNHYDGLQPGQKGRERHRTCLCRAELRFASGLGAEVIYGKGESIWLERRRLEVWGRDGQISLDGDQGQLLSAEGSQSLAIGSRRGLFAEDTRRVLDHLLQGTPLYVDARASLYSLKVAAAAQVSATTGQAVRLPDHDLTENRRIIDERQFGLPGSQPV